MKKNYAEVEVLIIATTTEDVIRTSGNDGIWDMN